MVLADAFAIQCLEPYEAGWAKKTGLPTKHCAYEAASAYELRPDPLPVACDYTLCNLAHEADIVVE